MKETVSFATPWIDLGDVVISEISRPEQDKCRMISLRCGICGSRRCKTREWNAGGRGVGGPGSEGCGSLRTHFQL